MNMTVNTSPARNTTPNTVNNGATVDTPVQAGKGNGDGKTGTIPDVKSAPPGGTSGTDPTQGMSTEDAAKLRDSVASAKKNWDLVTTDDPNSLFAVMIKAQAQITQQNKADALAAREAAKNAALDAASQTKKSADELKSGAGWAAVISGVTGLLALGGGAFAFRGLASAGRAAMASTKATKAATDVGQKATARATDFASTSAKLTGKDLKVARNANAVEQRAFSQQKKGFEATSQAKNQEFMQKNTTVQAQQQMLGAAGSLGTAGANYASASGQADSKMTDAAGQASQAMAETNRGVADQRQATADSSSKMMDSILEFLKNRAQNAVDRMGANTKV